MSKASLPEGWKLVPVIPTQEMHSARYMIPMEEKTPQREWEAMLDAAPTPPEQDDEPVAWVSPEALEYGTRPNPDGTLIRLYVGGTLKRGIPLYNRPDQSELRKVALLAHRELCILGGSHNKAAIALLAELNKVKE